MERLFHDVKYSFRMMRKSLPVTLAIVLSIGIGIGANAVMFSIINALFLKPLPYPDSERLALLWLRSPGIGIERDWPSPGQYHDILTMNHVFDKSAFAIGLSYNLAGRTRSERVGGIRASSHLLPMLGAQATIGRIFLPEEDQPGKPASVVLSYALWTRMFGRDPHVLGQGLTLDGSSYTIVGVLKPNFLLNRDVIPTIGGIDEPEVFLPLPQPADLLNNYDDEVYNILARLKPGVKIQAAQANIDVIANRIRDRDKRDRTFGISAVTLRDQAVGQMRQSIWVMFGAVGFLLLIVCANVTNLLLSRAAARQKEVALRTALGASKWRIVRQSLTESGLLALLGAVVGLVLASFGLSVLSKLDVGLLPRVGSIGLDARVVLFTLLLSVFSGVIFSMAPALRVFSPDLVSALRAGGRTLHGGGGFKAVRNQVRSALVVSEVALALAVVISAGLLIRSFVRLLSVPPGFTPDHVVSMQISLTDAKYKKPETKIGFYENAARRIRQTPGVLAQGAVSALPFSSGVSWGSIAVEGYVPPARQTDVQVDQRIVTPGFFETLKIPLRRGRLIAEQDLATALPIAVVDERMARRFWPGQDPVGKRVRLTDERRWMTVVGVVGTVKQYGLDAEERATLYMPYQQKPVTTMYIVARTATGGASMSLQIAQVIQSVDPSEPVYDISPMQTRIDNSLLRQRMSMAMLVFFACAALVLAAIGVYGVLSYVVAQGGRDIGIRMMLGAQPANVLLLVLRYGMGITSLGLLLGIGASFALGSVMQSLLFGIKATDTVTFLVSIPVLAIVALLATYVPARRALRVDPMETFRSE